MCSLRSWPTQKPRPVAVSTTQRTAGSSATERTASRSATLVATSRLFMASGRLRVIVATPSVTSSSTGASVMGRTMPHPASGRVEAPGDETVGARLEPGRLAREQVRGGTTGPGAGEQLLGQAGVGEEELAPLVHEVEARGEGRLVGVAVGRGVQRDQVVGLRQPAVVRRPQRVEVPGRRGGRVDVVGACG